MVVSLVPSLIMFAATLFGIVSISWKHLKLKSIHGVM